MIGPFADKSPPGLRRRQARCVGAPESRRLL